jgi:single-stranded-DNA-specific exonuclease
MSKRWRIHTHDPDRIRSMQAAVGVSPVVAQLLVTRGIDDQQGARDFLACKLSGLHDPELLPGAAEAAELIYATIQAGERITVYGDYDVDGMAATAILYRCLKLLGADVGYYVPNRLDEGYGLNEEALQSLAERGTRLVISVDCGIASIAEAAAARRLNLRLIITDHHEFAHALPEADVLVHPRLAGSRYPFGELCGAGVALKLAWALCQKASNAKRVSPAMRDYLMQAVGLAALGTVADVVPLVGENRVIVRHGLVSLHGQPTAGLAALLKVTELDRKPSLTSEDIGFMLAPRMNAAGRLGQAQLGVELLATDDAQRSASLAEYIHQLNSSRQSLERSIYLAAKKQAERDFDPWADAALVLADVDWHRGVIGIVAGRLAEKYHRPVAMVSLSGVGADVAVGSARSVPGFNLHAALEACSHHLLAHGGHAAAAGFKIDPANLQAFRADFRQQAADAITEEQRTAELLIDAETTLGLLTRDTVVQIESLAPFGAGNIRPMLCATGVSLVEPPQRIGNGRHLSMWLDQQGAKIRAVAFGAADWEDELNASDGPLAIAFQPVINQFRGRSSVELHVKDWRPAKQAN